MSALFGRYSLPELAERWAKEIQEPMTAVCKLLASAVLDGELVPTYSEQRVALLRSHVTGNIEVHLKQNVKYPWLPQLEWKPLNELPPDGLRDWTWSVLSPATNDGALAQNPAVQLILIERHHFKAWLQKRRSPLPAFWFPDEAQGPNSGQSLHGSTDELSPYQRRSETTAGLVKQWRAKEKELRREDPNISDRRIARIIANDKQLNPPYSDDKRRSWETIRQILREHD